MYGIQAESTPMASKIQGIEDTENLIQKRPKPVSINKKINRHIEQTAQDRDTPMVSSALNPCWFALILLSRILMLRTTVSRGLSARPLRICSPKVLTSQILRFCHHQGGQRRLLSFSLGIWTIK